MDDYSKIDFNKFPKREWKGENINISPAAYNPHILRITIDSTDCAVARKYEKGWVYTVSSATSDELNQLMGICAEIDAFIAYRSDFSNFTKEEINLLPTKSEPRWVDVKYDDYQRLIKFGCIGIVDYQGYEAEIYRIDAHTLPHGVPLHLDAKLDSMDQYHASKLAETPSCPRPCTKEFAISHPNDSEWRSRRCCREYWSEWTRFDKSWPSKVDTDFHEFRTTIQEESKK